MAYCIILHLRFFFTFSLSCHWKAFDLASQCACVRKCAYIVQSASFETWRKKLKKFSSWKASSTWCQKMWCVDDTALSRAHSIYSRRQLNTQNKSVTSSIIPIRNAFPLEFCWKIARETNTLRGLLCFVSVWMYKFEIWQNRNTQNTVECWNLWDWMRQKLFCSFGCKNVFAEDFEVFFSNWVAIPRVMSQHFKSQFLWESRLSIICFRTYRF